MWNILVIFGLFCLNAANIIIVLISNNSLVERAYKYKVKEKKRNKYKDWKRRESIK